MVNSRQNLDLTTFKARTGGPVEWRISDRPVDYAEAVSAMEARAAAIAAGEASELVWLLEHHGTADDGDAPAAVGPRAQQRERVVADLDAPRPRVQAVLDQLFDDRGRPLDDLAGGDLVHELGGKNANGH